MQLRAYQPSGRISRLGMIEGFLASFAAAGAGAALSAVLFWIGSGGHPGLFVMIYAAFSALMGMPAGWAAARPANRNPLATAVIAALGVLAAGMVARPVMFIGLEGPVLFQLAPLGLFLQPEKLLHFLIVLIGPIALAFWSGWRNVFRKPFCEDCRKAMKYKVIARYDREAGLEAADAVGKGRIEDIPHDQHRKQDIYRLVAYACPKCGKAFAEVHTPRAAQPLGKGPRGWEVAASGKIDSETLSILTDKISSHDDRIGSEQI
jgi:hypothetical protein